MADKGVHEGPSSLSGLVTAALLGAAHIRRLREA